MRNTLTVGITGGSGSGKTFFLQALAAKFPAGQVCLFSQDHYYKAREQQPADENGVKNFDLPEAIDREAFLRDLLLLKAGHDVQKSEYVFNNPALKPRHLTFQAAPILLVEGLFVQCFPEIDRELDLRIFLEAKDHVKLGRRIRRDQVERGYDLDDVLYRYQYHVMPVFESLIEPLKHKSDLVIPNNGRIDRALEVLAAFLSKATGPVC